jgi:hypothetical protein
VAEYFQGEGDPGSPKADGFDTERTLLNKEPAVGLMLENSLVGVVLESWIASHQRCGLSMGSLGKSAFSGNVAFTLDRGGRRLNTCTRCPLRTYSSILESVKPRLSYEPSDTKRVSLIDLSTLTTVPLRLPIEHIHTREGPRGGV